MLERVERKPNKFNEIFDTANNFLGPARGENPFVHKPKGQDDSLDTQVLFEPNSSSHADQT
jgi:hypothetical protein